MLSNLPDSYVKHAAPVQKVLQSIEVCKQSSQTRAAKLFTVKAHARERTTHATKRARGIVQALSRSERRRAARRTRRAKHPSRRAGGCGRAGRLSIMACTFRSPFCPSKEAGPGGVRQFRPEDSLVLSRLRRSSGAHASDPGRGTAARPSLAFERPQLLRRLYEKSSLRVYSPRSNFLRRDK
jgi:hypothetical protein